MVIVYKFHKGVELRVDYVVEYANQLLLWFSSHVLYAFDQKSILNGIEKKMLAPGAAPLPRGDVRTTVKLQ